MLDTKKLAARIQEANYKFAAFFARWPSTQPDGSKVAALLDELPVVFRAIEAVGKILGPESLDAGGASAASQASTDTYFANLRRFRAFLTELEPALVARRDLLAADRARLQDVKAWSKALKLIG